MADIPINPVTRRVEFTGNTGTGPFAFTFNVLAQADIAVYKNNTLLALTSDYTVSLNSNGTGSITLVAALIASDELVIIGDLPLSRTTDFVTAGDLLASSLNQQFDSNVVMSQQLDERFDRTIRSQPGDINKNLYLPLVDDRVSQLLSFDSSGNITTTNLSNVPDIGTVNLTVSGLASFADGSLGAPSITNIGDTNTGIYFPAADQLAFTAGGNNIFSITSTYGLMSKPLYFNDGILLTDNSATALTIKEGSNNYLTFITTNGSEKLSFGKPIDVTGAITTNTSLNIASSTTVDGILDEDNMASNSATKLATQQSIKAYVDAQVGTVDTLAEVLGNGNTTGANNIIVTAGQSITVDTISETTAANGVVIDGVTLKDGGATVTADVSFGDNDKAIFGAGSDLQIYHDGFNSYVQDVGVGNLYLKGTNLFLQDADGNDFIALSDGGAGGTVYLKHFGTTRLNTTGTGIDVTGTVTADGLTVESSNNATGAVATLSNTNISTDSNTVLGNIVFESNDDSAGATNAEIKAMSAGTGGQAELFLRTGSSGVLYDRMKVSYIGDISFYEDTGTTAKFFWDASAERLGIGNSSPATTLDVTGTITADDLDVQNSGFTSVLVGSTNATGAMLILDGDSNGDGSGGDYSYVYHNSAGQLELLQNSPAGTNEMLFKTAGNNLRMKIGSGGDISFYEDTGTTAKFFWDASAEVLGVGTSSPNVFSNTGMHIHDATTSRLHMTNGTTGSTSTDGYEIQVFEDDLYLLGRETSGDIVMYPASGEAMRIDSSGRVGIGTSSPVAPLDVVANSGAGCLSLRTRVNNDYSFLAFRSYDGTEDLGGPAIYRSAASTSNLLFYTANGGAATERMRIDSSGGVHVGGTSESGTGQVSLNPSGYIKARKNNVSGIFDRITTDGDIVQFRKDGTTVGSISSSDSGQTLNLEGGGTSGVRINASNASGYIRFRTAGAERMRIDSSGNVGIGSAPSHKLHVEGAGTQFIFLNNASTNDGFYFKAGSGASSIQTNGGSNVINFFTAGTERMRIDSSGNLLVGTTSLGGIDGVSLNGFGYIYGNRAGGVSGYFDRGTSDGDIMEFRKDGAPVGSIGVADSGDRIYLGGSGTNRGIAIDSSASVLIPSTNTGGLSDGLLGLGTSTARFANLYLSGGVISKFSVTSETELESYNNNNASGAKYKISFKQNGTQVGVIEVGTSSTAYNTSSDYRLKENVVDLTGATDRLKKLEPKRFNFIADEDITVDGFLAHEVQSVVPEAISGTKDAMRDEEYEVTPAVTDDDGNVVTEAVMGTRSVPDYQGIDQSKLVPLLVATIKELEARITVLENA